MKKTLLILLLFANCIILSGQQDQLFVYKKPAQQEILQVFPNPATNYISITDNGDVSEILIYNLVGKRMRTFTAIKGERYNVADLPKGMYLVQLLGIKREVLTTRRINIR